MQEKKKKIQTTPILETADDLLRLANKYYPDDGVVDVMEKPESWGDTLALFLVKEIRDVFEADEKPSEKLHCAIEHLSRAVGELSEVTDGLTDCLVKAVFCEFFHYAIDNSKPVTAVQFDAWCKVTPSKFDLSGYDGLFYQKFKDLGLGEIVTTAYVVDLLAKLEADLKVSKAN